MLELDEALDRVTGSLSPLNSEEAALHDLPRRILAEPLVASLDLPVADNSSMDGYAVRADDLKGARPKNPIPLQMLGIVPAGEVPQMTVLPGTCVRVFTGSFLPAGADAVLMQEETEAEGGLVRCLDPVTPWENIRFRGEDVKTGTRLLESGEWLRARHLGLIAATGRAQVRVSRRPRVGILATGHELQEAGQALAPGAIFESNRVVMAELVRQVGGIPTIYPLVEDTMEATTRALGQAIDENDAVVTTGGVSVGDYDLVRPAIEALGGRIEFWRVRLRPGKPFVFARFDDKPLFGLPGNPVSAVTTFMILVRPGLLKLQGARSLEANARWCRLTESVSNSGDRPHFFRVRIDEHEGLSSAGLQGSHALQSLSQADGWLRVDPKQTLEAGALASIMVWDD